MAITLYHVPRTISSPLVQILLELEVVNNPVTVLEMTFPLLKSKEYLEINPMGTSPAFRDSDLGITMWESGGVLDYLLERYDGQNRFHPSATDATSTPEQIQARAKYLHLKQYIIATVYPFIASLYIHSMKDKGQQDKDYMTTAKHKCQSVFGLVLTEWLGDGPYFLGERISAVDFLAAKPLANAKALGLLSGFPALDALLERVSIRSTYTEAYQSNGNKAMTRSYDQTIVLVPSQSRPATPKKRVPSA